MASHPTPSNFLRSQRTEFHSTSSSDFAALSLLPITSTPSCIFSDQTPLPSSLARMPPSLSLISPATRPVGSQSSARRGRPVSLHLPVRPSHTAGLPFSSVSFVTSSLPLEPPPSAPIELFTFVNHPSVNIMGPESATISIDFITLDVQSLSCPPIESAARVVGNDLPSSPDRHEWEWPPEWESHPGEPY